MRVGERGRLCEREGVGVRKADTGRQAEKIREREGGGGRRERERQRQTDRQRTTTHGTRSIL